MNTLSFTEKKSGQLQHTALTWDCVDISDEAIETNSCYIVINKIIERVSVEALDFMDRKDIITIFPTQKRNNTTVVVMKTPKTETSNRGIWTYSGRGPQKECPAYGKCFL